MSKLVKRALLILDVFLSFFYWGKMPKRHIIL